MDRSTPTESIAPTVRRHITIRPLVKISATQHPRITHKPEETETRRWRSADEWSRHCKPDRGFRVQRRERPNTCEEETASTDRGRLCRPKERRTPPRQPHPPGDRILAPGGEYRPSLLPTGARQAAATELLRHHPKTRRKRSEWRARRTNPLHLKRDLAPLSRILSNRCDRGRRHVRNSHPPRLHAPATEIRQKRHPPPRGGIRQRTPAIPP